MSYINENFLKLQENYLFSNISKKVDKYKKENPKKEIINLGIGDVTRPIIPECIKAMNKAINEMADEDTFKGYGPEQGYEFLRKAIVENDYKNRNIDIELDEIFISDGAKCDCGNILDIFSANNTIAITNPVYPVYIDTNVMTGGAGEYDSVTKTYKNIKYLKMIEENNFIPEIPEEKIDLIYLCFPNNPTGAVLNKKELKKWIQYAKKNNSIIFFDSAYEAFITEDDIPHSIYEIEGAKEVAIEFKSFSKTAGFTGLRCAYIVIPKELKGVTIKGEKISINKLWNRRVCTKFNGVSYIIQKAAEAIYTSQGKKQIQENINYYLENAHIIKEGLQNLGFKVYGGTNSPYIWLKVPENKTSWEFFDLLLEKLNIVGTPGSGFGINGEGYFRLTGFGTRDKTEEAMNRFNKYFYKK